MTSEELDRAERDVIYQIEFLKKCYMTAVKPYADRLIELRSLRPSPPVMIKTGKNPEWVIFDEYKEIDT